MLATRLLAAEREACCARRRIKSASSDIVAVKWIQRVLFGRGRDVFLGEDDAAALGYLFRVIETDMCSKI